MIDPDDKPAFAELFTACCLNYGRDAAKETMRLWWSLLAEHDYPAVAQAVTAHLRTSSRMPSVSDILDLIHASNSAMRRPGADEAWARMPRSEDDSVVWTEEMAYAWGIASSLVNPYLAERPDWVAARMAFKDAYTRACDTAKAQGRPVAWTVARGHTRDNLEDVLTEAMRLGLITPEQARPHLAELEHVRPVNQTLLLEGVKQSPEAVRDTATEAVARLRAMLTPDQAAIEAAREEAKRYCEARDRDTQSMRKSA